MPYYVAIYDWSLYTLPSALPMSDIEGDTHANNPSNPGSNTSAPSWIGETFTYNGGSSIRLEINDDDSDFNDAYVDPGTAQTLAQDVTINGVDFFAGDIVENEFSMLDASGNAIFVVRIDGVNVGFAYPAGEDPTVGQEFIGTVGRDGDPTDSDDGQASSEAYANIVCYAEGTSIITPDGPRAVEALNVGDVVTTLDHGPQVIRWVRSSDHPLDTAAREDKPVLIAAGALGPGRPAQDLIVSPQHRMLVGGGGQLDDWFETESFAPAKALTKLPGIRHMKGKQSITWIHFACERHELVFANGCLSESLLLGPMVLNGLTIMERQDLTAIYGAAPMPDTALNGPPARACLKVGEVRRHLAMCIRDISQRTEKEIRKWDRDLAMERYEAELLGVECATDRETRLKIAS